MCFSGAFCRVHEHFQVFCSPSGIAYGFNVQYHETMSDTLCEIFSTNEYTYTTSEPHRFGTMFSLDVGSQRINPHAVGRLYRSIWTRCRCKRVLVDSRRRCPVICIIHSVYRKQIFWLQRRRESLTVVLIFANYLIEIQHINSNVISTRMIKNVNFISSQVAKL
jgi:hypothetical protein